jgi:hypothetical protein
VHVRRHFVPTQTGTRGAKVTVAGATVGNPYPTLTLSGLGGPAPIAPPTTSGSTTISTTSSAPTTTRPFDQAELVTCRAVAKRNSHLSHSIKVKVKVKIQIQQCTGRRVSCSVTFTANAAPRHDHARQGGVRSRVGDQPRRSRWQLLIQKLRPLRPGAYTLTLHTAHGPRCVSIRLT